MAADTTSPSDYAVVVGLDLNGLGVVRSLGQAGVPIVVLDTDLSKPTAATRFGLKKKIRALAGQDFIADLLAVRAQFSSAPVLFLTHEASVITVSAERARLSGAYRFTMPSDVLMQDLLDKLRFQALAERHGFPIPRALRLFDGVPEEGLAALRFPCVVKPTGKHREYAKRFAKAYKVSAAGDALRLWSAMREVVGEIIVQEWIEGSDSDVYFCLQYRPSNLGASASFVGRKTCQWPILVGGTASCMPAPDVAAELTALTDGFFSKVGFVGIGSMEYKRDPRDGRFYMVEPTVGRTDYQEEVATLNGVNIPLAAYLGELGLPAPPPSPKAPLRAWRDPSGFAMALRAGASDPTRRISPGIGICDAYRRLSDPMPYIALKWEAVQRRLSRLFHRAPKPAADKP